MFEDPSSCYIRLISSNDTEYSLIFCAVPTVHEGGGTILPNQWYRLAFPLSCDHGYNHRENLTELFGLLFNYMYDSVLIRESLVRSIRHSVVRVGNGCFENHPGLPEK